jgi:arylsulfatase A-like enzyme
MDWAATILAAAGAAPDPAYPLDGEDLLAVLAGAAPERERTLFWRHGRTGAARSGRWKYLRLDEKTERLYDLSADEREQADFSGSHKEVFEGLRARFRAWDAQMLKKP